MIIPKCIDCLFWSGNRLCKEIEKEQGNCHRFPIQVAGLQQRPNLAGQVATVTVSAFPMSPALAWCGEFQPAQVQQGQQVQ